MNAPPPISSMRRWRSACARAGDGMKARDANTRDTAAFAQCGGWCRAAGFRATGTLPLRGPTSAAVAWK